MRSKEDIKYGSYESLPQSYKDWIKKMDALFKKKPKDLTLSADGALHLFSNFKDGSVFNACTHTIDGLTEANECHLHKFPVICDGGDFW